MYLKEIKFQNYGALKDVNYTFQFNPDGTPKPTVFIGKNGSGKTLLLSNIIHSLIEIKRKFYHDIAEVSEQNYYRLGSKFYIYHGENQAYTKISFDNGINYMDLMLFNYDEFKEGFNQADYPGINIKDVGLIENGHYVNVGKPSGNIFDKEIFVYFPVERYYIPTWENKKNEKLMFAIKDSAYVGYDDNSMIKNNILQDIEEWILDVLIDRYLYDTKIIAKTDSDGNDVNVTSLNHKNIDIINYINNFLSLIFVAKFKIVRFGVTHRKRGTRQIQIIGINDDGEEYVIAPTLSNLSSREIMVFGMIVSILKEYDRLNLFASTNLDKISGIVLIDEIDLHLHSDLLKRVLPNLIRMFPKIQFVLTSHSPFFLLGMKERFGETCNFVTLPTGTLTNQIERFDEIERCYAIIDDNYKEVLNSLDDVQSKLKTLSKPLIITEGKTDWKHIKHALSAFQAKGEFQNIDIEFWEYENTFGDSKLETLLENISMIPNSHKIIGIFDSDNKTFKKYKDIYDFGNNVYACCIQDVHNYGCGISIELLYNRDDLKICDENERRLYLSDEFKGNAHRLESNSQIICHNKNIIDACKRNIIKVIDSEVYDNDDNNIALSKHDFADNIYHKKGQFANVNVDGFKDILEKIRDICDR